MHEYEQGRVGWELTVVVQELLNQVDMGHEHSPATIADQPQCIKGIPVQKHYTSASIFIETNILSPVLMHNYEIQPIWPLSIMQVL